MTETEPFPDHFRTIDSRALLCRLTGDDSIILEVRETTPDGGESSMCRPLPDAALPKCLLRLTSNRVQEIQTAFSTGCVRPTPCSHWCPCLGAAHTPRAAQCQGTPVLPTPPSTISRHRSARGWPAYRQQAAAGRLPRGEVSVAYMTPLNVCSPSPQYSPIRPFRVLPQPLPLATLPSPILRCLSRPRDAAQRPRLGHSGGGTLARGARKTL